MRPRSVNGRAWPLRPAAPTHNHVWGAFSKFASQRTASLPLATLHASSKGTSCQVRDENWDVALFRELGSAPATLEAGKACDAFDMVAGHEVQQADAEQACAQSRLGGAVPTWLRIPPERRPSSWAKYWDPVCPLILALYGHPESGPIWAS